MTSTFPHARRLFAFRLGPGLTRLLAVAGSAALMAAVAPGAFAQSGYPDRPIRLIATSAAGGGLDASARQLAEKLTIMLKQQVVVENVAGAGGILGAANVAKATPDGYTLLFVAAGYTTLPSLHRNLPFTHADLAPVALAVSSPFVMVAAPSAPYKTLTEFIAYAKSNPGKVNFASGGNGTAGHLLGTWLKSAARLDMVHIPFKGENPALQDLLSGQVSMMPLNITSALQLIRAGKLQPLAISGSKRSPLLPDVPTITEQSLPVQGITWFGMLAPAATPKPIINRLNEAVNQALQDPALRDRLVAAGLEIGGGSPGDFQKLIEREAAQWGRIIKELDIKVE
jgi:tripartite-type tricarboxylate transporter receptor subunit TctC